MKSFYLRTAALVLLCELAWVSKAQILSNSPSPQIDPVNGPLPMSKDQFWAWGIAAVTPVITWLFGKIPQLPRPVLPVLTPFIGMVLGFILKKAEAAHLSWYSAAAAGSMAVFIRESVNQLVTKQLKPREESKTEAKPVDGAVAVHAATVTPMQVADAKIPSKELESRSVSGGPYAGGETSEKPANKGTQV